MKPFTVMVPCSTSNLGPGFDSLGLALGGPDLMVRVTPGTERIRITHCSGEGASRVPLDATNRVIQAAQHAAVYAGIDPTLLHAELAVVERPHWQAEPQSGLCVRVGDVEDVLG